jgi:hypothetical protein
MSAPGLAVPTDWRRAFDQCMLDLLRGRPRVAQAPALVLRGLCQQARAQHTQSEPQVRMFWVLAGHFFDHLIQTPTPAPWQNWHTVVCARIMAAAPGLAPMAPTPNQQAEALSAMFLEFVHAQVEDWQSVMQAWADAPQDAEAAHECLGPTAQLHMLLGDMQLDGMADLCAALLHCIDAALAHSDLAAGAERAGPAVPEMLRLLHQYAAGFVRSPDPSVLAALRHPAV